MTTVTHADTSALKFCNRGLRQFFERHGLDWQSFVKNGIDSAILEQFDDAMVKRAIAYAKQREQEGA